MEFEKVQSIFNSFMLSCNFKVNTHYEPNAVYNKIEFDDKTGEIKSCLICSLFNDISTGALCVGISFNNKELLLPINITILNDENKFIEYLFNIKNTYFKDYQYLLKCAIESERKLKIENDFKK